MRYFIYLICGLLSLFIVSCNGDKVEATIEPVSNEYLMGKWMIYEAMRDDEPTLSLDRAEIDFKSKDTLISNLFDSGQATIYQYAENKLYVKSSRKEFSFMVEKVGIDSILIEGKVGRNDMKLYFLRLK